MSIKSVFIDLSGTLHVDNDPTPEAAEALKRLCSITYTYNRTNFWIRLLNRLRKAEVNIRFVTNTTKESSKTLFDRLINIGFELKQNEIFSSLNAAVNFVKSNNLNPFYILSSDALTDFPPIDDSKERNAVVIGLSPKDFNYDNMNKAFSWVDQLQDTTCFY